MEPVKLSEFSINKRMVAKIWGDVQKQNKTNDRRVTSFQCSRHGGYVIDPKDFSSSELESLGNYGKGMYVYTGLSFFRELPAGVPGAYKLFMNILALGQ